MAAAEDDELDELEDALDEEELDEDDELDELEDEEDLDALEELDAWCESPS